MTGRLYRASGYLRLLDEQNGSFTVVLSGDYNGEAILPRDILEAGGYKRAKLGNPICCSVERRGGAVEVARIHSLNVRA